MLPRSLEPKALSTQKIEKLVNKKYKNKFVLKNRVEMFQTNYIIISKYDQSYTINVNNNNSPKAKEKIIISFFSLSFWLIILLSLSSTT